MVFALQETAREVSGGSDTVWSSPWDGDGDGRQAGELVGGPVHMHTCAHTCTYCQNTHFRLSWGSGD